MLTVKIELPKEKDYNADLMKSKGLAGIKTREPKEKTNEKIQCTDR